MLKNLTSKKDKKNGLVSWMIDLLKWYITRSELCGHCNSLKAGILSPTVPLQYYILDLYAETNKSTKWPQNEHTMSIHYTVYTWTIVHNYNRINNI